MSVGIVITRYMSFYPKKATTAYTTGGGIGYILGSLWPYILKHLNLSTVTKNYIGPFFMLIFPTITILTYFFVLPAIPKEQRKTARRLTIVRSFAGDFIPIDEEIENVNMDYISDDGTDDTKNNNQRQINQLPIIQEVLLLLLLFLYFILFF